MLSGEGGGLQSGADAGKKFGGGRVKKKKKNVLLVFRHTSVYVHARVNLFHFPRETLRRLIRLVEVEGNLFFF